MSSNSRTVELARQLGAVRSRNLRQASARNSSSGDSSNQVWAYLLVLDFESTCWDKKAGMFSGGLPPPPEIIEFPVVLMNTSDGKIVDQFQTYVIPTEYPNLSPFCVELTGISQQRLDNEGVPIATALRLFTNWLKQMQEKHGFVINDDKPNTKSATFVTWSDWDLAVCLAQECRRKQLLKPTCFDAWCDLRHVYSKFYSRRPQGLNGALQDVGLSFDGREHSGISDAQNTARLVWKVIQDGCTIPITKFLNPKTIKDKFKNMTVTPLVQVNSAVNSSRAPKKSISPLISNTLRTPARDSTPKHSFNAPKPKRTPPMCGCGKRSKMRIAQNPGPNQGRTFYACPKVKGSKDCCKFFKWESDLGQSPQLRLQNSNIQRTPFYSRPSTNKSFKTVLETPKSSIINSPCSVISPFSSFGKENAVSPQQLNPGQRQYFGNVPMFFGTDFSSP